ncbi:unnamed protein product [Boreogadus saida]
MLMIHFLYGVNTLARHRLPRSLRGRGWVARCPIHPLSSTSPSCRHCCGSRTALLHSAWEASAVSVAEKVAVRTRSFRCLDWSPTFFVQRGRASPTASTDAQLHLSPFCLVQSCIEGLGPGEADMLPQTLRHQSLQEGVERQVLPCSRGEFRVAASGQQLDISSVDPQALLLLTAVGSQQLPALVSEDLLTEPPLQCFGQGLKVSLVCFVKVEQHPCCRPLQGQRKVDDGLHGTPAVVPLCKPELGQATSHFSHQCGEQHGKDETGAQVSGYAACPLHPSVNGRRKACLTDGGEVFADEATV